MSENEKVALILQITMNVHNNAERKKRPFASMAQEFIYMGWSGQHIGPVESGFDWL